MLKKYGGCHAINSTTWNRSAIIYHPMMRIQWILIWNVSQLRRIWKRRERRGMRLCASFVFASPANTLQGITLLPFNTFLALPTTPSTHTLSFSTLQHLYLRSFFYFLSVLLRYINFVCLQKFVTLQMDFNVLALHSGLSYIDMNISHTYEL